MHLVVFIIRIYHDARSSEYRRSQTNVEGKDASVYIVQYTEILEAYYSSLDPCEWSPASPFLLTPKKIFPGPIGDTEWAPEPVWTF
jgi:hypothetical protein